MKNLFIIGAAITVLASPFSISTAHAAAKCKAVTKLPVEITVSGLYCLSRNLNYVDSTGASIITGTNAILISADNTVFDLNGFTLSNGAAPTDTGARGIHVTGNYVTIRNGRINNFRYGVHSSAQPDGLIVENMTLSGNQDTAIYINAYESVVRNNAIFNTGGSTHITNSTAYGIFIYGDNATVTNNTILGVTSVGTGNAVGISTFQTFFGRNTVSHNRISNINSPSGTDAGIWFQNGSNHIASDNRITMPGSYGISYTGSSTGTYMNNLVYGATSSDYNGTGTAAGTTNN